jgi:hypothetical protein
VYAAAELSACCSSTRWLLIDDCCSLRLALRRHLCLNALGHSASYGMTCSLYMHPLAIQQEGEEEKADEPRIVQYVQRKKPSLFKVYKGEFWVVLHRCTLQNSTQTTEFSFTCCNRLLVPRVEIVCSKLNALQALLL